MVFRLSELSWSCGMRESRFRFWDKHNKVWVGPYTLEQLADHDQFSSDREWQPICSKWECFEPVEYIGRKDAKGNEIYEGDIIGDNPDGLFKSIVKHGIADIGTTTWDDKHFASYTIGFYAEYDGEPDREMTNLLSQGDVIVVGNIYENPELIS